MPQKHVFTVRLSAAQYRLLQKLSSKLGLKPVDVLRLALTRLSEAEGLLAHLHDQKN